MVTMNRIPAVLIFEMRAFSLTDFLDGYRCDLINVRFPVLIQMFGYHRNMFVSLDYLLIFFFEICSVLGDLPLPLRVWRDLMGDEDVKLFCTALVFGLLFIGFRIDYHLLQILFLEIPLDLWATLSEISYS